MLSLTLTLTLALFVHSPYLIWAMWNGHPVTE